MDHKKYNSIRPGDRVMIRRYMGPVHDGGGRSVKGFMGLNDASAVRKIGDEWVVKLRGHELMAGANELEPYDF